MKHSVYISEIIHSKDYSWEEQSEKFIISMSKMFFNDWCLPGLFKKENITSDEYYKWMTNNLKGKWVEKGITYSNTISFYMFFEFEEDAMAFKLRWL